MPEKNTKQVEVRRDDGVELETQFILRIPEEPAKLLREAIAIGSGSLKERMAIKLDNELRYGEVRFDHWLLHAKVIDLPTVIESLKTIDNKSFYKTADICQLMICKEEPDHPSAEEDSPNKNQKKKDPNKVDKKFLHPHGITPPCKNIRKRRFRKTLKKKYVEAPEIEKEVKQLLRVDNDAVNVKWEIINEDDETIKGHHKEGPKTKAEKAKEKKEKAAKAAAAASSSKMRDIAEHDIFGGEVSTSEDEETNINVLDIDETSRLSAEDSRLSDSNSNFQNTSFDYKSMFATPRSRKNSSDLNKEYFDGRNDSDIDEPAVMKQNIEARIEELRQELSDLKGQRAQKEQEIAAIQNQTLRQRLQDNLDNLMSQIIEKEMEIQDLQF